MSERMFRFILGASLILLLFLQLDSGVYVYIGLLLFEGLTNWRIPRLVSRLRFGSDVARAGGACGSGRCGLEAERALRLIVAAFLVLTFVLFPEPLWFFPWFVGFMLFMAGLTNICPMVMGLRRLGLR